MYRFFYAHIQKSNDLEHSLKKNQNYFLLLKKNCPTK